jgi:HEPN domain-containing protein
MSTYADLIRGLFAKGNSDLLTAELVAHSNGPYDTACFHSQQAAEKYLKGYLSFLQQPFPFTHNLEQLELICKTANPTFDLGLCDVTILTPYAVQLRYDAAFWPDQATALEAIQIADHIRAAILALVPQALHPNNP